MYFPKGNAKLNKPYLTLERKFFIVMQDKVSAYIPVFIILTEDTKCTQQYSFTQSTLPSVKASIEGGATEEIGDSELAACISELKYSSGADVNEASGM